VSMEEFVMDHPWAADIPKSQLLLKLVEFLENPHTMEEIAEAFPQLTEDDVAKALYVLKRIGVVDGDGEKVWLADTGKEFLKLYHETF
jgi:predicted transcriptional regulator